VNNSRSGVTQTCRTSFVAEEPKAYTGSSFVAPGDSFRIRIPPSTAVPRPFRQNRVGESRGVYSRAVLSWLRRLAAGTPAPTACSCGAGSFDFEIVGESFYQDRLRQISAGRMERGEGNVSFVCYLRYELNSHTHLPAVRVDASGGRTVGHFPAEQAEVYAPILRAIEVSGRRAECVGVLVGGYGQHPTLGVYLDFKANLLK
jgi:hypothetical protein